MIVTETLLNIQSLTGHRLDILDSRHLYEKPARQSGGSEAQEGEAMIFSLHRAHGCEVMFVSLSSRGLGLSYCHVGFCAVREVHSFQLLVVGVS